MGKSAKAGRMNRLGFLAAFILLSLSTVLLLVYSVQFINAAFIGTQLSAWMAQRGLTADATALHRRAWLPVTTPTAQAAAPPVIPQTGSQPAAATAAATAPPQPSATLAIQPTAAPAPATPEPIFQVVEAPPPDGNLVIPALGIDAPLAPIPVSDEGWDLETLGTQIGWLETTGAHPNDNLAMVVIGHITLPPPGGAGPFLKLNTLKPGDVVGYRSGSATYLYEVKRQVVVKPDEVASLYQPDGKKLLLVTCTGYNALKWRYDLRLIVEAELVSVDK